MAYTPIVEYQVVTALSGQKPWDNRPIEERNAMHPWGMIGLVLAVTLQAMYRKHEATFGASIATRFWAIASVSLGRQPQALAIALAAPGVLGLSALAGILPDQR